MRRFEVEECDLILLLLATYSPSQIALPALQGTHPPILVWNIQGPRAVSSDFTRGRMIANYGVHGTLDLCNLLLRHGVSFEYVTSHLDDADGLKDLADFSAAASRPRSWPV